MTGTYKPLQQELAEIGYDGTEFGLEITCQEDAEALLDRIRDKYPEEILFDKVEFYEDIYLND